MNFLASAIGGLLGLSSAGAGAAAQAAGGGLMGKAAPAAIGAGIGALAAGGTQQDAIKAAGTFGMGPASRAQGITQLERAQQILASGQPQMAPMTPPQVQQGQPMQMMPQQMQMPVQMPMQQMPTQQMQMPMQQPMPQGGIASAAPMQQMGRPFARGGYIEGPGTGRSDSIPAMIYQGGKPVQRAALSDGEFVMTERAVRGAGGGDRARGAARMYRMMREFEKGGRV